MCDVVSDSAGIGSVKWGRILRVHNGRVDRETSAGVGGVGWSIDRRSCVVQSSSVDDGVRCCWGRYRTSLSRRADMVDELGESFPPAKALAALEPGCSHEKVECT
jgi:hypothetical protein